VQFGANETNENIDNPALEVIESCQEEGGHRREDSENVACKKSSVMAGAVGDNTVCLGSHQSTY
jgi:hypothetical protein